MYAINTNVCPINEIDDYQKFLNAYQNHDYEQIIFYLTMMNKTFRKNNDLNVITLLMSYLTDLPEQLKKNAKSFSLSDLEALDTNNSEKTQLSNRIREDIINNDFRHALVLAKKKTLNKETKDSIDDIIILLLRQVMEKEDLAYQTIASLIYEKKYGELINYICDRIKIHSVSNREKDIVSLAKEAVSLLNDSYNPSLSERYYRNISSSIEARNYQNAYDLINKNKNNITYTETMFRFLLKDILTKISDKKIKSMFVIPKCDDILVSVIDMGLDFEFVAHMYKLNPLEKEVMALVIAQEYYFRKNLEKYEEFLSLITLNNPYINELLSLFQDNEIKKRTLFKAE